MKTASFLPALALAALSLAFNAQARPAHEIPLTQHAKVLSVITAPPYVYVEAQQGGKTVWLAGNGMALKKGDAIAFDDGMVMHDFHSKALKRTFPSIIFVNRLAVTGKPK